MELEKSNASSFLYSMEAVELSEDLLTIISGCENLSNEAGTRRQPQMQNGEQSSSSVGSSGISPILFAETLLADKLFSATNTSAHGCPSKRKMCPIKIIAASFIKEMVVI